MATNFPASLDTSTTIPAEGATTALATNHVTAHQNIQDAIEAIEAKVGVDSSAVTTSHDYKLGEVTGSDKAVGKTATQTLTNKTLGSGTAITLGSDAEGDTYYRNASGVLVRLARGSDNHILKMNGNVPNWEAETVNSNASTTVAGIVELATSSEINAGTGTGGTGAALVVTPDALASSAPTFDGSNLTGTRIKLSVSTSPIAQISNSSAENNMFSYSLAGGVLSTNNAVRVEGKLKFINTTGGAVNYTIRFKYGSTTLVSTVVTVNASNNAIYKMNNILSATGATNTQRVHGTYFGVLNGSANLLAEETGTATEDSTTSKNIIVSVQMNTASVNATVDFSDLVITKIV